MSTGITAPNDANSQVAESTKVTGRDLSFYNIDAKSTLDDAARKLIIDYAGVATGDVDKHVDAVVRFLTP
jgi:hypothetical protein